MKSKESLQKLRVPSLPPFKASARENSSSKKNEFMTHFMLTHKHTTYSIS